MTEEKYRNKEDFGVIEELITYLKPEEKEKLYFFLTDDDFMRWLLKRKMGREVFRDFKVTPEEPLVVYELLGLIGYYEVKILGLGDYNGKKND